MTNKIDTTILEEVSKEKFRRRIMIASRILAVFLIVSIMQVAYVQMKYAKEVNEIKSKYGNLGYCYMCGLENYRICSCQYNDNPLTTRINLTELGQSTANKNIEPCPVKEGSNWFYKDINLSELNITFGVNN